MYQQQQQPDYYKIQHYTMYPKKVLGKGAFGTVLKGYDEKERQWLAVKTIPLNRLRKESEEFLFGNEIDTLCGLKVKNIVQLKDAISDDLNLYLFFEYCDGGDLERLIKVKKYLSEKEACNIVRQIAEAFVTINKLQNESPYMKKIIMHRDIKPANILFHQGVVKVSDFGFAKSISYDEKDARKRYENCGTPYYTAPQILGDRAYSAKCDIWSIGVLFYEILFGKMPWNGTSSASLYKNIRENQFEIPREVSPLTEDLLIRMLMYNEEDRISWEDMYDHPALKEADAPEINYEELEEQRFNKPLVHEPEPNYYPFASKEVKKNGEENKAYDYGQVRRPIFDGKVNKEIRKDKQYYGLQKGLQQQAARPAVYNPANYQYQVNGGYTGMRQFPTSYLDKK